MILKHYDRHENFAGQIFPMVIFKHSSARNFFVALTLVSGTTGFSEMNLSTVSENLTFPISFCMTQMLAWKLIHWLHLRLEPC